MTADRSFKARSNQVSDAFQRPSNALPSGVTTPCQPTSDALPTPFQRGSFQPPHTPPAPTRAHGCAHAREKRPTSTPPAEIDRLLHWMPIIVGAGGITDWERKFCASMISRQRRNGARPSEKQIRVMQRIVRAFQEATLRDEVVDEGGTP